MLVLVLGSSDLEGHVSLGCRQKSGNDILSPFFHSRIHDIVEDTVM
jgi:hypothetical protein